MGFDINEAFPSQFMKVSDLKGRPSVVLTIDDVTLETIGQGKDQETKPVATFVGTDKKMVLNKTNSKTIAALYGPNTENWQGQKIRVISADVEFQGSMNKALRVANERIASAPAKAPVAVAVDADEEAPF